MVHILSPEEGLERAKGDYLNVSRNKNNTNLYREFNYWPAEELAWQKLQEAIQRAKEAGLLEQEKSSKKSLDSAECV